MVWQDKESDAVEPAMRVFETGATRGSDRGKLQYTQFLSPRVLRRYAEYLQEHSIGADGQRRTGDTWKKGMPQAEYLASMLRHVMELWEWETEGWLPDETKVREDLLCAIMFNAMGMLYEKTGGK